MIPQVGDTIHGSEILVRPEALKLWSVILRDPNPIHLDPEAVRRKGLGDRTICQGPASAAHVINALQEMFVGAQIEYLAVRFLDNVFAGEIICATATITSVQSTDRKTLIHCDVTLKADGREALSGTAAVSASRPPAYGSIPDRSGSLGQ
jgi:acyl dehydratase